MKIKHILLGALMTVIAAPAIAQVEKDEVKEQVIAILKSGAADKDKQVSALAKEFKKDAAKLASVGKAYLAEKDFVNAKKYAAMAVKANGKSAEGFILAGNIAVAQDDAGEAATQFQQAMYADPKNPNGYRRYAQMMSKASPQDAVNALEALRQQRPDYPVDLIAAEIYSDAGKMNLAIQYYDKVSINDMKDYQISDYATNLFLSQNFDKSLDIATQGHNKFARNASFNRLMMFNNTEKKDFAAAIAAGERLFTASDSAKISSFDYGYYGRALEGADKYQEAIGIYEQMLQADNVKADEKLEVNKKISDCYKKVSNYAKAEEYLNKYIQAHPQSSFSLEESVAELYADQLSDDKTPAAQKQASYEKADALYAALGQKYPDNAAYVANKRAQMPFSLAIDQKAQLKLAGPHYIEFANIMAAKSDRTAGETKMLINAYNAATFYYVHVADDMEKAKEVAAKVIEIDPENENAKAILSLK